MIERYSSLNPEKALIWRIVHRDNLPWILDNGLHCGNCPVRSKHWIHIGNAELISKRATHPVPLPPGGTLKNNIDRALLQRRDFRRDPNDPWKLDRYQAEALIHKRCPVSSLLGVVCYNDWLKEKINREVSVRGLSLQVHTRSGWYF